MVVSCFSKCAVLQKFLSLFLGCCALSLETIMTYTMKSAHRLRIGRLMPSALFCCLISWEMFHPTAATAALKFGCLASCFCWPPAPTLGVRKRARWGSFPLSNGLICREAGDLLIDHRVLREDRRCVGFRNRDVTWIHRKLGLRCKWMRT